MSKEIKRETIKGRPIIYDETVRGKKYILLDSDKPDSSEIMIQWTCSNGTTLESNSVRIPNEILSRMAAQVSGEGREVLLDATSDQVTAYLRDNLEAMHACLEDPARLPALIASFVTVVETVEDEAIRNEDEACESECEACDFECEVCGEACGEACEFECEACDEACDEVDIVINTDNSEFILIRYAIRAAYEMLRKGQIRELEKKKHGC